MARSRYQYGTSPRKIEPDYQRVPNKRRPLKVVEERTRQQIRVSREEKKKQFKMTVTIIGLFLLLVTISCRNSQIDKKFTHIQEQKKQLATLQKENEQLKVSIENSQNLSNVEKIAKEELGMQKLTSKQTIYVSIPKKDYVEPAGEKIIIEENKNWWQEIAEKILNF